MNGDPGEVYSAALEVNEEQHVIGHQTAQRQHLGGEKVGPRQQRQVGPNEGRPCCRALALRRRRQTMASQDIADRLIGDLETQIGQRPRDPVIAPVPVLAGHANDQLLDLPPDPRSARASTGLRAIELAGDKLAIPAQDSVRSGYGRDVGENLAAQPMTDLAERASLGVREFQLTIQLRLEDAVLGGQIFVPRQQLLVHRPRHGFAICGRMGCAQIVNHFERFRSPFATTTILGNAWGLAAGRSAACGNADRQAVTPGVVNIRVETTYRVRFRSWQQVQQRYRFPEAPIAGSQA